MAEPYHLDALHDEAREELDRVAARLWPDLVTIDDYKLPSAPFLDELQAKERRWLR